jgi:hypothetical protein
MTGEHRTDSMNAVLGQYRRPAAASRPSTRAPAAAERNIVTSGLAGRKHNQTFERKPNPKFEAPAAKDPLNAHQRRVRAVAWVHGLDPSRGNPNSLFVQTSPCGPPKWAA